MITPFVYDHGRPHAPVLACMHVLARAHRGRDFDTRPLSVSNAPLTSPVKRGRTPPAPIIGSDSLPREYGSLPIRGEEGIPLVGVVSGSGSGGGEGILF